MSISAKTVGVNAAFFREVKEENQQLNVTLAEARQLFADPNRPVRPARRAATLRRLRDQLAMHFALEDAYGYFDDAVHAAPQLTAQADRLRAEHDELFLEICDLVDFAEQLLYREPMAGNSARLASKFQQFDSRLSRHEEQENLLIFQALDDDIGVGD